MRSIRILLSSPIACALISTSAFPFPLFITASDDLTKCEDARVSAHTQLDRELIKVTVESDPDPGKVYFYFSRRHGKTVLKTVLSADDGLINNDLYSVILCRVKRTRALLCAVSVSTAQFSWTYVYDVNPETLLAKRQLTLLDTVKSLDKLSEGIVVESSLARDARDLQLAVKPEQWVARKHFYDSTSGRFKSGPWYRVHNL